MIKAIVTCDSMLITQGAIQSECAGKNRQGEDG